MGRPLIVNAHRAATQDDRLRVELFDSVDRERPGVNFAVNVALADAASDELRVLRAVVEDEDGLPGCHGEAPRYHGLDLRKTAVRAVWH